MSDQIQRDILVSVMKGDINGALEDRGNVSAELFGTKDQGELNKLGAIFHSEPIWPIENCLEELSGADGETIVDDPAITDSILNTKSFGGPSEIIGRTIPGWIKDVTMRGRNHIFTELQGHYVETDELTDVVVDETSIHFILKEGGVSTLGVDKLPTIHPLLMMQPGFPAEWKDYDPTMRYLIMLSAFTRLKTQHNQMLENAYYEEPMRLKDIRTLAVNLVCTQYLFQLSIPLSKRFQFADTEIMFNQSLLNSMNEVVEATGDYSLLPRTYDSPDGMARLQKRLDTWREIRIELDNERSRGAGLN